MRRTLPRGERTIRVANDEEAEVEAIGELPLEISNDFTLHLHDVLYVSSMRRNLIYVSCLDDDGFDCLFGKKQYLITFNDKIVGRALRHDKLYLLFIKDSINVMCSENNVNVSSSKNKRKRLMTYLQNYGTVVWATFRGGGLNAWLKNQFSRH
jgi:hypothetical protein